jgi:hypothetical protein
VRDSLPQLPPAGSDWPRRLAFLMGVALIAAGQVVLSLRPDIGLFPSWLKDALEPVWPDAGAVLFAIVLLVMGAGFLAREGPRAADALPVLAGFVPAPPGAWKRSSAVAISALALFGVVLVRLWFRPDAPAPLLPFFIAILGALAAAYVLDAPTGFTGREGPPRHVGMLLLEGAAVLGAVGLFLVSILVDVGSWYYSALGDEYNFYDAAAAVARHEATWNLFSQRGAYDIIPVASSFVTGQLMRIVGQDAVGWKIAEALPIVLAVVLMFLVARVLFGRATALAAVWFFAGSHYLLAYAHTGYPNLEPLPLSVAAVAALVLGIRGRKRAWFLLAGMCAGLGWYTYYTSRALIAILGVATLLSVRRKAWFQAGGWVATGFLVVVLPMLAVSRGEVFSAMFEQTGAGTTTEAAANRHLLPLWNTGRSLLAFNYNTHDGPYLHGSLLEPITAVCFVAGLAFVIGSWRDGQSRLVVAWYGVGLLVVGVISKYDYVSVSRLNFLLPVVSLCAAVGLTRGARVIGGMAGRAGPGLAVSLVAIVVVAATASNLHRFFVETPAKVPSTADAVVVRAVEDQRCLGSGFPSIIVERDISGALYPAFPAIGIKPTPEWKRYSQPLDWLSKTSRQCVIFRSPNDPDALRISAEISKLRAGRQPERLYDDSGKVSILVFYPPTGRPGAKPTPPQRSGRPETPRPPR